MLKGQKEDRIWVDEQIKTILYGRISSSKQKTSLAKQKKLLKDRYPKSEFVFDVASGFNQNRREYRAILELAINKTPVHIVATTSDRITRTGFQVIKWIVELSGGRIELLEEKDSSEKFDSTILISFITSFINSYYGKRSAIRRKSDNKQKDKDISEK